MGTIYRYALGTCLALVLAVGLGGCDVVAETDSQTIRGTGDAVDQERNVSGVTAVEVANEGDLTVVRGDTLRLVVQAQNGLLPYIESDVESGILVIRTREGYNLDSSKPIRYHLTVPTLTALTTSSGGDIVANNLAGDALHLRVSSDGDISIGDLDVDRLVVEIASSGNVVISGGAIDQQEARLSSSGSLDAKRLSFEADPELTSMASIVRVSDKLDARLSSAHRAARLRSKRRRRPRAKWYRSLIEWGLLSRGARS